MNPIYYTYAIIAILIVALAVPIFAQEIDAIFKNDN